MTTFLLVKGQSKLPKFKEPLGSFAALFATVGVAVLGQSDLLVVGVRIVYFYGFPRFLTRRHVSPRADTVSVKSL